MTEDREKRFMQSETELINLSDEGKLVRQMMENLHTSNVLSIFQEIQGEIGTYQQKVNVRVGVTSRHLSSEEKFFINRLALTLSDVDYVERMKRDAARVAVSLTYNFGAEQVVGQRRIRSGEYEQFYARVSDVLRVTSHPDGKLSVAHLYLRESDRMMKRTSLEEFAQEQWGADEDLVPSLVYELYEKHPLLLPHPPFQK
jgi:GH24 family phage-related lysozyme (muramidase)